ncbi:restriction endonuclease subunit S [Oscillatoriales cyanobacterium USR001]|nr:restriction endonuclease subunit S [Oscillatoriales cyanobacterium USR001]
MPIPSEIQSIINRLNQELDRTEENATEGLNLVRLPLSLFPDNLILVQFFAYLNNVIFFVGNYRRQIQGAIERLSVSDVNAAEIQETGEELATMLGVLLEAKIRVEQIITRLRNLP